MSNPTISKTVFLLIIYYFFVLVFFVFLYSFFDYQLLSNRFVSLSIFIFILLCSPLQFLNGIIRRYLKIILPLLIITAYIAFIFFITDCPKLPTLEFRYEKVKGEIYVFPQAIPSPKPSKLTKYLVLKPIDILFGVQWDWIYMCSK